MHVNEIKIPKGYVLQIGQHPRILGVAAAYTDQLISMDDLPANEVSEGRTIMDALNQLKTDWNDHLESLQI